MRREEIERQAQETSRTDGIPLETALEGIIKALPPSERALEATKDQPSSDTRRVFQVAAQGRLFKAGMFGTAVTVWSSYEGGYERAQVMLKDDEPIIIRIVDEDIEDQIQFAGGYVCGFVERLGGDLDKLDIWLELHGQE